MKGRLKSFAALGFFAFLAAAAPARAASLVVDVIGADPPVGQLLVAVYASDKTFLKTPAASRISPVLPTGSARIVFPGLPPGEYAVAVIHDRNGNGKLDQNLLGIPAERYGFSNNARGRFGPPGWRFVRFGLAGDLAVLVALGPAGP